MGELCIMQSASHDSPESRGCICISTGQEEQEFTSTYTWTHSLVVLDIDP